MADWSQLPTVLLELVVGRLETSFEIVHSRSVCSSWRSVIPPPDNFRFKTLIPLPLKGQLPLQKDEYCTIRKIPIFLLRFKTPFGSDYLLAEIRERKAGKPMLMSSPLSRHGITTTRHKMFFNSLSSQIIPFGHYYEMTLGGGVCWPKTSERVEFLKLDGEDCKCFVVLSGINSYGVMMFTSCNMKWTHIVGLPEKYWYQDMVAFKGKFYVVDSSGWGQVFAIELSLEVMKIPSVRRSHKSDLELLVKSGEELLLVQRFTPRNRHNEGMYTWFIVFRLDERKMKWVQVNDLKDRVIFLGPSQWNLCCSVQKLPGAKENCIVFIDSTDESILLFDLRTRRTSKCRGCMGAFGLNLESLVFHGVVALPNEATSVS